MKSEDTKLLIAEAIKNFSKNDITTNSLNFFNTLGYNTERQNPLDKPSYQSFKNYFVLDDSKFNEDKALVSEWNYVNLLFQLTKDEVLKQTSLFDTKKVITKGETQAVIESYLFFVIELKSDSYTRGNLAEITRQVNKLFPMPVMILFKYNNFLTLSIINRRLHKKDSSKDVLEKVTLIKDILIPSPSLEPVPNSIREEGKGEVVTTHRAHIEILYDLSFTKLYDQYQFKNFVDLHNAWQKTLDIKELNAKFFKELSNWYFWAVGKTVWPDDSEQLKKKDVRNATNVIRLITRLIFVWFLKEKNLVPYKLFVKKEVEKLLKFSDSNKSSYYKAILQNLFFATLNTEMGKRKFRTQSDSGRSSHYFIHNLFRYKNEFVNPEETLKQYFDPIPFLNGGLFECLDDPQGTIRIDGFSDRPDNVIKVPDELFFLEKEKEVDLNKIYGTKNKRYKVRGLLEILNSYKFTITENTPIEEEVALDPELLGKVFENLLASYNPETQTTARKQTGSFYTPREIVNYMVDESIIAYLKTKMMEGASSFVQVGSHQADMFGNKARVGQLKTEEELTPTRWTDKETELENELRKLISYSEEQHKFTPHETELLIEAIDNCKILDPACGSGAFPMGVLHKLVHILHKLDPNNDKWKELQRKKAVADTEQVFNIDANSEREELLKEINETFDTNINYPDYGRKIYLVENCLFGVDIQPIAVQIAKLRFFISLLIEQKVDWSKPDKNYNIKPLPNLETKIVAANTLIGIEKPEGFNFRNKQVEEKEKELSIIRHKHFNARNYKKKVELRKEDERLRKQIGEIIKKEYEHFCNCITEDIKREQVKINSGKKSIQELEKSGKSEGYIKEQKEKYSKSIKTSEKLIEKLTSQIENNSSIEAAADKIANWDPYNHNTFAEFFDPEWMFGLTKGFDIVIGNPPYIQMQKDEGKLAEELKYQNYLTYERTGDVYQIFYENGLRNLNKMGIETFITSSQWMKAGYGRSLRKLFISKNPLKLIVLGPGVFESATVDTNVLIIQNTNTQRQLIGSILDRNNEQNPFDDIIWQPMPYVSEDTWVIMNPLKQSINETFIQKGKALKNWDIQIYRGVLTGYNEAFIIDEEKRNELIKADPKSNEIIKPVLRGREIDKYYTEWDGSYLIATFPSLNIDVANYKSVKKYLEGFLPKIQQIGKKFKNKDGSEEKTRKRTSHKWFETQDPISFFKEFEKEKVIWKRIGSQLRFTYSDEEIYCLDSTCIATGEKIKYLTALLNSKLCQYQLFEKAPKTGMGDLIISVQALEPLLVYYPTESEEKFFSKLLDYILILKKQNQSSSFFERLVDAMVYELYFPEEIKAAGCEVLKHLTDLPELKEDWSDEKKLKTIEKVYKELSDPNHPVSIAMQKMQEVEEVRIIEGKT